MRAFFSRRKIVFLSILILAFVILGVALDCRLAVKNYEIDAAELTVPVRIAFVSDLHSCYYGKNEKNLVNALLAEKPDLLLLGGDIFDDELGDTNTELFLAGAKGHFPIYYVTGNHEHWAGEAQLSKKLAILKKYGVNILSNEFEAIEINGHTINVCGVTDPSAYKSGERESAFFTQLERLNEEANNGSFSILLSHRPEYFEKYVTLDFDLVLSGHAHGGQWRIPLILNGLYAPNQGLFPKYAGGRYDENGRTMIVSRGLARESTPVPRIFNRPELVIIEIK